MYEIGGKNAETSLTNAEEECVLIMGVIGVEQKYEQKENLSLPLPRLSFFKIEKTWDKHAQNMKVYLSFTSICVCKRMCTLS